MLYLIFLVVIHLTFAQNYSCSSEASTQTSGEGPSGLAPTSSWFSTALGGQDQEVDCHLQKTSFTGSQTPCSATCRDGQTRSVEVQILYAPGQGQIRTMWRLLEVLVTMQRLELCAPAATAPSTSTWRSLHHRLAGKIQDRGLQEDPSHHGNELKAQDNVCRSSHTKVSKEM